MRRRALVRLSQFFVAGSTLLPWMSAADATDLALDRTFTQTVRPFLASYCAGCHGTAAPAAQFDIRPYTNIAAVVSDLGHWNLVLDKLTSGQMPPKQLKQPPDATRRAVIDWIQSVRSHEAKKNAGDPGPVLARRLSNSEYNYTIRDLTGVDMQPTREFPVDPANPAGFDNSGESLAMSPSLLNKYLQAAREVANHMVLTLNGIEYAPHLVLVETDRDKYCVGRIIDFYHRQNTEYSDYFLTAWRFKHRAALGKPRATLASLTAENKVSPKYLATIWHTLEETREDVGPLAKLQLMWRDLPAPKGNQPDAARDGANRMRDFVVQLRKKLETRWPELSVPGINRTSQPFLMYRNRQYATHRTSFDKSLLQVEGEYRPEQPETPAKKATTDADNVDETNVSAAPVKRLGPDADLHVPAGQRAAYEAAFTRFAAVFPDAFYISERGRYFPDNTRDTGRHLSAGFHNLMGYFRDDQPLYDMILDAKQQKQLDEMWQELDFVASANIRTYVQFYLFESREAAKAGEGGTPSAEDKDITSEPRIRKVAESYLARARASKNEAAVKAVEDHFKWVNDGIRWVEKARMEAEPKHLDALLKFASRAYRHPLSPAERTDLLAYYKNLREK